MFILHHFLGAPEQFWVIHKRIICGLCCLSTHLFCIALVFNKIVRTAFEYYISDTVFIKCIVGNVISIIIFFYSVL